MRTEVRGAIAACLALAAVVAASAPASAVSTRDPAGDAPARHDLTRIRISNDASGVSVLARVRDLQSRGTQIVAVNLWRPRHRGPSYLLHSVRRGDGRTTTRLWRFAGGAETRLRCGAGARWRPSADTVEVRMPRECLPTERTVLVTIAIGAGDGSSGDPADFTEPTRVPLG